MARFFKSLKIVTRVESLTRDVPQPSQWLWSSHWLEKHYYWHSVHPGNSAWPEICDVKGTLCTMAMPDLRSITKKWNMN